MMKEKYKNWYIVSQKDNHHVYSNDETIVILSEIENKYYLRYNDKEIIEIEISDINNIKEVVESIISNIGIKKPNKIVKKKKNNKKKKISKDYNAIYGEGGTHKYAKIAPMIIDSIRNVKFDEVDKLLNNPISISHDCGVITQEMVDDIKNNIIKKGSKNIAFRKCSKTGKIFPLSTSDLHQTILHRSVRNNKR